MQGADAENHKCEDSAPHLYVKPFLSCYEHLAITKIDLAVEIVADPFEPNFNVNEKHKACSPLCCFEI